MWRQLHRNIYLKPSASKPQKCRKMRDLFVITCSFASKWLFLSCHGLTAFWNSKSHIARWGMCRLNMQTDGERQPFVSYAPVKTTKPQRAGRVQQSVNEYFAWDEESRVGPFRQSRELVIRVMNLLEHWRRNISTGVRMPGIKQATTRSDFPTTRGHCISTENINISVKHSLS